MNLIMDIDVDQIPIFLREYKPITKNIRIVSQNQVELIEKIRRIPGYETRFMLPLQVVREQTYAIIEEKGEGLMVFLERNEKQRGKTIFSTYKYLSESLELLTKHDIQFNELNIVVYNGRPMLDILGGSTGTTLRELYTQICLYFSLSIDSLSVASLSVASLSVA
jgi:hypothetical protein